jgi:hypothetical protein
MGKRIGEICLLFCGFTFFFVGVISNFLPEIIKQTDVMTPLFVGIGLIILTGFVKNKAA